jgi:hypothetical protein
MELSQPHDIPAVNEYLNKSLRMYHVLNGIDEREKGIWSNEKAAVE